MLGGKPGHFKEWKAAEFAKEQKYANASELERQKMELEDRLARIEKQQAVREQNAKLEAEKARTERTEAQLRSLEAQLIAPFDKHRFAGKLGNAQEEQRIDQAIWDQAIKALEALPDNVELTPAMIEQEFKKEATAWRALIGKQASSKAKQAIETRKQAAQTQVAAAATRSIRPGTIEQSMHNNIKKGGIAGLTAGLMDVLRAR